MIINTSSSSLLTFAALTFSTLFLQSFGANNNATNNGLVLGFYKETCPQAESIVRRIISESTLDEPNLPGGLMRIFFHDCFIKGCDASILLDNNGQGERASFANGDTLRGLDTITEIKSALESECPQTVSCADIIAFAARDSVAISGLPLFPVPAGRRDSRTSNIDDTMDLPSPGSDAETLIGAFSRKGFTEADVVAMSGAHSIGRAHCQFIENRLYNFTGGEEETQDPDMDEEYAMELKIRCPRDFMKLDLDQSFDSMTKVPFDDETSTTLDVSYYERLLQGKGLLSSDNGLVRLGTTKAIVEDFARNPGKWEEQFVKMMMKLGTLDVKVGDQEEVRVDCMRVNDS